MHLIQTLQDRSTVKVIYDSTAMTLYNSLIPMRPLLLQNNKWPRKALNEEAD